MPVQLVVPIPDISTETNTKTVCPRSGGAGRLKKADVFIEATNCSGVGAALTVDVQKGAASSEVTIATASLSGGDLADSNVEAALTITDTSASNISENDRITFKVTCAGADYSVATGAVVTVVIDGPANP